MITRRPGFVLLACTGLLVVSAGSALGQTRASLIEQARSEFSESAGMALLLTAVSGDLGGVDSLWTVATHDIAATLLRSNNAELATLWVRLSVRHGSEWPIDSGWFEPAVVALYQQVASLVAEPDPAVPATTRWQFPATLDPTATGNVRVTAADQGIAVDVTVVGGGTGSGALELRPGSYEILATAQGFDTVRVIREVLPGTTTVLAVELRPVLAEGAEQRVLGSLVRIERDAQASTCATGFVADEDGWILTAYDAVRGPDPLFVSRLGNLAVRYEAVLRDFDEAKNLAVLKLPVDGLPPLVPGSQDATGPSTWTPHFVRCGPPAVVATPLSPGISDTGPLLFASPTPAAALGAPIIDRQGGLVGVVVDDVVGLRAAQIGDLVERARRRLADEQVVASGGGGSWKWMAGGLVVAGGVFAALSGGDGGDGSPAPGTITVTVP